MGNILHFRDKTLVIKKDRISPSPYMLCVISAECQYKYGFLVVSSKEILLMYPGICEDKLT